MKITFGDLSTPLKIAIVMSWVYGLIFTIMFIVGFIIGLTDTI